MDLSIIAVAFGLGGIDCALIGVMNRKSRGGEDLEGRKALVSPNHCYVAKSSGFWDLPDPTVSEEDRMEDFVSFGGISVPLSNVFHGRIGPVRLDSQPFWCHRCPDDPLLMPVRPV